MGTMTMTQRGTTDAQLTTTEAPAIFNDFAAAKLTGEWEIVKVNAEDNDLKVETVAISPRDVRNINESEFFEAGMMFGESTGNLQMYVRVVGGLEDI